MDDAALRSALIGAGTFAILAGTGGYLRWVELCRRPPLQRPAVLWHPAARVVAPLLALLTALGLVLLALGSPAAALVAAALLATALLGRLIRVLPAARRRRVAAALAEYERRHPALAPAAQRRAFLAERRPEWGEGLAAQLVDDWPERSDFIRFVAGLEGRLSR
jgi:hypothetical protein